MKRSILHIILLLWAMLPATTAHSQSYPVQSNVYVVAPYSQTYSDYYADGQQRMFVNILLNDMSQGHLDVVLRFSIKSNNLKLTSKLTGNVQPITIHSGKMYRVEGSELAQYLRVDDMQAEGRLAGEFQKSGKLPEGYYEIKVEVVEYYRRANVSAPSYSTMWIMQPEAPVWTMPQNNAKIDAISPQFMLFGWMMTGNTSMLRNIKYEFSIYDKPASMSADVVVKTSTPIYSEELTQQTLVYGPDKPLLELGKVYACRVKVEDGDGLVSFKNDGYSSTLVFKYGEECDPPTQVTITDITKKGATVNWVSDQSHSGYDVEVRELSDGKSSDWFTWKIDKRQYNYEIKQLSSDSRYECRVAAVCGQRSNGIRSAYTDPVEFKTYEAGNKKYNCGDLVEASKPTNRVPYPYLEEGDVITANGFVFIIESISKAGGGLFTGQCSWYINLWGVKILCDFKDISINVTRELIGGQIVACHDKAQVKAFTRLQSAAYMPAGTQVPTSFKADKIMTMTETVDSVRIVDGETLIYVAGQNPVKVSATDNVFVQSADGNYYAVEDGKVYPKPSNLDKDGNRTLSYNQLITATFGYDDNFGRHAGVDAYSDEKKAFAAQYSQYQLHSDDAYATWIAKNQTAVPIARVTVSGGDRTALQFRNGGQAVAVNNAADADALYLPLTADGQYDAYYTTQDTHGADLEVMAGQLNVVSYPQQNINVCLVEVNGASYPRTANELSNYLNDVFGQAVFGVNLTKTSIEVDKFNGTLSARESGALSAYNPDMKKLIKKVKRLPDYNSDTYYIMVVAKSDNSSLAGFMPVNSNFGFVFADACNSTDMLNRTIAHELAHGAFHLWHTFSSSNTYTAPQGTTANLMDYNGTNAELYKYQWDYIHNPQQGIVRWMVDEEESEAILNKDVMLAYLKSIHNANVKFVETLALSIEAGFNFSFSGEIELDDETSLSYLSMSTFSKGTAGEKIIANIKPSEKTCESKKIDDEEYTTYTFKSTKYGDLPPLVFTVKSDETTIFEEYVFRILTIEKVQELAEKSVSLANESMDASSICNVCTRTALYFIKNDSTLFPYEGSALKKTATSSISYVEGYTTNNGQAKKIQEDFEAMKSEYARVFEEIKKENVESWQQYFTRLQDMASAGEIIIGAMLNSNSTVGHVMMITPGEMADVWYLDDENIINYVSQYGKGYYDSGIKNVPIVVECGQDVRKWDAPLCTNVDRKGAVERLKWYRYKK